MTKSDLIQVIAMEHDRLKCHGGITVMEFVKNCELAIAKYESVIRLDELDNFRKILKNNKLL